MFLTKKHLSRRTVLKGAGVTLALPLLDAMIPAFTRAATKTAVVMDEAYAEFSAFTAVPWIRKFPHLFVARTFSKVAGLASLRLGAVIAGKESLALVRRAMPPFPVNLAALVAAEAAVRDRATMRAYVSEVKRLRAWLATELQELGVKTYPSAGNFLPSACSVSLFPP